MSSRTGKPRPLSPARTHHRPSLPSLPTAELLSSIASGAHYAGALQSHPDDPPLHGRHWRVRSRDRSTEDAGVELKFQEVMEDLRKACTWFSNGSGRKLIDCGIAPIVVLL